MAARDESEGCPMMEMNWYTQSLEPVGVYNLLHKHDLLPALPEQELLSAMRVISAKTDFGMVVDDEGKVLASTFTTHLKPGVLGFTWIPEVKRLHTFKDDLALLAEELRAFWFKDGIRRVEAYVPVARTQTTRALKGLGFRQETLDCGIRGYMDYGHGYEAHIILGLLPDDPVRKRVAPEVAHV